MKKIFTQAFTLIEVLIAIGVFSILVVVGVGGFTNALRTQREVAGLIAAQSNASVALEQMAREIRTGYLFCNGVNNVADPNCAFDVLGKDANGNDTGCISTPDPHGSGENIMTCTDILDFYNAYGQNIDYVLSGGALERSETGLGNFIPITSNEVAVKYLTFTLFGNTEGDHWPPRITISLGIAPSSTDPAVANDVLNLQTTISAREIDCTQGASPSC